MSGSPAARKMVSEAQRNGILGTEIAASLTDVPNIQQNGIRLGNWLTREQARELLQVPDRSTLGGKRDYVILALLVGCALRRQELATLEVENDPNLGRPVGPGRTRKEGKARPHRRRPALGQAGHQRLDNSRRDRGGPATAIDPQGRPAH